MARLTLQRQWGDALRQARTVAILGASARPSRAGHYVAAYLAEVGYRVFPVNPALVGQPLFGEPVVASLAELPEPVDLIDVFRRPDTLPGHTDEILALPWRPRTVWLQLGVDHPPSVDRLVAAGIDVVVNRCTMVDHRRLS